jgi:hypothetical protein
MPRNRRRSSTTSGDDSPTRTHSTPGLLGLAIARGVSKKHPKHEPQDNSGREVQTDQETGGSDQKSDAFVRHL